MADELVDIYDEDMNRLGTVMKSQALREELWHKIFHCWIVRPAADGHHKVWFQLRSKNKKIWPNLLDVSASGHLKAGETDKDGVREIEEELGLKVDKAQLTKLFSRKTVGGRDGMSGRVICPNYVWKTDKNPEDVVMQPEEVDGIYEADIDDVLNLMRDKVKFVTLIGLRRNEDNSTSREVRAGTAEDFAQGKEYYIKVMEMLKRYCTGSIMS